MIWVIAKKLLLNRQAMIIIGIMAVIAGCWLHGWRTGLQNSQVEQLQKEKAVLQAELDRIQSIQNKAGKLDEQVNKATQGIEAGMLPDYTSAVLDCLRSQADGKDCVRPSTTSSE